MTFQIFCHSISITNSYSNLAESRKTNYQRHVRFTGEEVKRGVYLISWAIYKWSNTEHKFKRIVKIRIQVLIKFSKSVSPSNSRNYAGFNTRPVESRRVMNFENSSWKSGRRARSQGHKYNGSDRSWYLSTDHMTSPQITWQTLRSHDHAKTKTGQFSGYWLTENKHRLYCSNLHSPTTTPPSSSLTGVKNRDTSTQTGLVPLGCNTYS